MYNLILEDISPALSDDIGGKIKSIYALSKKSEVIWDVRQCDYLKHLLK